MSSFSEFNNDPQQCKHIDSCELTSTDKRLTWGNFSIEEMLESNVVSRKDMAILKEEKKLTNSGDPSLVMDLRHNRAFRATFCSPKMHVRHSEVLQEAKRALRIEDRAHQSEIYQNKLVDEEIKKFQEHIDSLRKLNTRLGLATTAPRRRNAICTKTLENPFLSNDGRFEKFQSTCKNNNKQLKVYSAVKDQASSCDEQDSFGIQEKSSVDWQDRMNLCTENEPHLLISGNNVKKDSKIPFQHVFREMAHSFSNKQRTLEPENRQVSQESCNSTDSVISKRTTAGLYDELEQPDTSTKKENTLKSEKCHFTMEDEGGDNFKLIEKSNFKMHEQRRLDLLSHAYAKWMAHELKPERTSQIKVSKTGYKSEAKPLREGKIAQVLHVLKNQKESTSYAVKDEISKFELCSSQLSTENLKSRQDVKKRIAMGSFQHRFEAQKKVIMQQKAKLDEQKRQIDDFKLVQVKMEVEKSRIKAEETVNYILDTCDNQVKHEAKMIQSSLSSVDSSQNNQFFLRMEERALEREQRKLFVQERKRQLEEEKQKNLKLLEEKKCKEEKEAIRKKYQKLEELKREERETRETIRKEREKMIFLERKAESFFIKYILQKCFNRLKISLELSEQNLEKAVTFYESKLMRNAFRTWNRHANFCIAGRFEVAEEFYKANLLRRCLKSLIQNMHESTTRFQVAEDMHLFRLQERAFRRWVQYTHSKTMQAREREEWANSYYSKNLVEHTFKRWKQLPFFKQEEREKERRKMMWRNKVQEILPDFCPILLAD